MKPIMRECHPFPLFNTYLPMRQRIYCTVWPPSVRVAIGRGMMLVACVAMRKRAWTKDEITISAHMAYDLLDASYPGHDDLLTPLTWYDTSTWYILILAVKILMIRNLSRDGVKHQAGLTHDKLLGRNYDKET